jgi:phage protein D
MPTETSFGASAPVFSVDGRLVRALARDCLRLEVSEGLEGLRRLEAQFFAVGPGAPGPPDRLLHLDGSTVDFGRTVQVTLGPDGLQRHVFEGVVSAIEAVFGDAEPPRVVVLAEDALMRLRMTRRTRTYRNVSDATIAAAVAREHGLQADVDADGPTYDVVQQLNQSDLAFLRDRARLVRAELWCTHRTLHFRSRPRRQAPALTLVRGHDLLSVRLCADLSEQRSAVVVGGYDAGTAQGVRERAGAQVIDAEVTAGRTGPRLVEQALGESVSYRVRDVPLVAPEAAAWARAEMLRRARRFVTVHGLTRGTPDLVVGSRVRLELVGAPFDGDGYYVTHLRHTFDLVHGFQTRFEAERATMNSARR